MIPNGIGGQYDGVLNILVYTFVTNVYNYIIGEVYFLSLEHSELDKPDDMLGFTLGTISVFHVTICLSFFFY